MWNSKFEDRTAGSGRDRLTGGQPEGGTEAPGGAEIDFQRKPEGASVREHDGST